MDDGGRRTRPAVDAAAKQRRRALRRSPTVPQPADTAGQAPPPRPQAVANCAAAQRTPPARLTLAANTRQPLRQSAANAPVSSASAVARPTPKARSPAHAPRNWTPTSNARRGRDDPARRRTHAGLVPNLTSRRKSNNPPNRHSSSQCRPWRHHKVTPPTACHPWC